MKLTIPNNPGFTGVSFGLKFMRGVSEDTTDEKLVKRLCKHGYALVEEPEAVDPEDTPDEEPAYNFDEMTVAELKEFAKANEIDLGEATRKADIIEVLKAQ